MNFVVWNGAVGRVCSKGIAFDLDTPPVLNLEFDMVFYEPALNRMMFVKDNINYQMTDEQIALCESYCEEFESSNNYLVWAYDDSHAFVGEKFRQDPLILNGTYHFLFTPPNHPASKAVGEEWKQIVATITDDGFLTLNPGGICPRCILLFTEEEWATFPKPTHDYETWDVSQEKWADMRILERLKENAVVTIQNAHEALRWKAWGQYVAPFDIATWPIQVSEANAVKADSDAPTPYMNTYLADTDPNRTKLDLAEDILAKSAAFAAVVGTVNAAQKNWLKAVEAATTNVEVDTIMADVVEATKPNTLRG